MKVKKIAIKNVLGIESLEINPGQLCVVSGRNGAGKTSVLSAIKAVLSGGHEPDLIRQGAGSAEVSITLEDGVTIQKVIKPEKSTLVVKHPTLGKISKSQAWLNSIVDSLSLDPVAFLTATSKDRVRILLEALPMRVTKEQLEAIGIHSEVDVDRHALQVIADLQTQTYDRRRQINLAAKEKRATAKQMAETLPADAPEGDWSDTLTQISNDLAALNAVTRQHVATVNKEANQLKDAARDKFNKHKSEVMAELENTIERLRADARIEIGRSEEERDAEIERIDSVRTESLRNEEADFRPREAVLKENLGHAKAMLEQQAKSQQTREYIDMLTNQAELNEGEADLLTADIQTLERFKADLLKDLPIQGLELKDGELYIDAIPFDRVNDARKHQIAIEIAKVKAGELGLLVLDRAEIFDSASWELFKAAAKASGMQIVAARVTDAENLEVANVE